ncbi:MAG TPA: sigma-70 family RNA polymerase sigma factor [Acidimicrobiales bacterium]|nr:sigma-70 family RNA polymerase sigma factor [Acidimicrobiales bacterium]
MEDTEFLAERFDEHRAHLRAVAYRMLGSVPEAEDAVQDAWLRLARADAGAVENLGGWLTTVVARVCLNRLRARTTRREEPLDVHVPDPVVADLRGLGPEDEAVVADSVGLALLVVLDTLNPAERIAFVLHDMFDVPFEDIAPMLKRTPAATRQLASRARRRVRGTVPRQPDADLAGQRRVVDAFFAAARAGDFDALVALLDPEVVLRIDAGAWQRAASREISGAAAVARQAKAGLKTWLAKPSTRVIPLVVNGAAGAAVVMDGATVNVSGFTVVGGRIVEIDAVADPERVRRVVEGVLDR